MTSIAPCSPRARDEHGLSYLQPGRFVRPVARWPMRLICGSRRSMSPMASTASPGSLGALMEQRFEVYKKEVVAKFYEDYFRNYARQIVLVDVLGALLAGREAFEDTRAWRPRPSCKVSAMASTIS